MHRLADYKAVRRAGVVSRNVHDRLAGEAGWENPAMVVNGWLIGGSSTVGRMVQLASAPGHPGRLNAMLLPWPVLAMWIASRRCSRP